MKSRSSWGKCATRSIGTPRANAVVSTPLEESSGNVSGTRQCGSSASNARIFLRRAPYS